MISVVMPVYNSEKFLPSAIESILNQSYNKYEFLIFNDASSDNSKEIINNYLKLDSRIKFYNSSVNKGYSYWLNESLKYIRSDYLVRMDADDVSDLYRFEKQYNFLKKNQEYSVVGSFIKIIDENDRLIRKSKYPITNDGIKRHLKNFSTFAHPSTMINVTYLNKIGGYRTIFEPAEDYDLWTRLSIISKMHNIPQYLLNYRQHISSVSIQRKEEQLIKTFFIKENYQNLLIGKDLIVEKKLKKIDKNICRRLFKNFNKFELDFKYGNLHNFILKKKYFKVLIILVQIFLTNPIYLVIKIYYIFFKYFNFFLKRTL